MATEKFEILNRWTGKAQFSCDLETIAGESKYQKLGRAVRAAYRDDADLSDADLRGAVLSGAVLRDAVLRGAVLRGADLSDADLSDAVLSDAVLRDADLSGADLSGADLRDADLSGADLSGADLRDAVLRGADLRDAVLSGADLSDADLSDAVLSDAVLRDADLSGAVLSGADLPDWIPTIPNIHATVFEAASKPNALNMESWHTCQTTHCRAGWVTTLAGEGGKVLEGVFDTPAAAALIYAKSDPKLEKVPDLYCSNEKAMEDMKRLAELEAQS